MAGGSAGYSSGTSRSLTGGLGWTRGGLYRSLETYVAQMTGSGGHGCLLRAMCEASATPLHDDGLVGECGFLITVASF